MPLHSGRVPAWLRQRMTKLGTAVVEAIICHYGRSEVLTRLSDPYWFQAFGSVLGMDWHSSGITTSVMNALKLGINPISKELGLYVCGGRGAQSRKTPYELTDIADNTGLDGLGLVRASRLTAKVDNTAIQDGFQLYLHSFVLSEDGEWTVIQQGMDPENRMARRYHWLSRGLRSFVDQPHTAVIGRDQGQILNLTHREADSTRKSLVSMSKEKPGSLAAETRKILMSSRHAVQRKDVNLKRMASVLATAHDARVHDFASLLLCPGLGPRTLQSLTLVSEVIHGTPSRFDDPARFSMAHGGKDGHPFPVPTEVYDKSIKVLRDGVTHAKLGRSDKLKAIQCLDKISRKMEEKNPEMDFDAYLAHERATSHRHGGRTVFGKAQKSRQQNKPQQLELL